MTLTLEVGREAVTLAREAVDSQVRGVPVPKRSWSSGPFSEERGVFVTLNLVGTGQEPLRGCIGFPLPVKKLGPAIQQAAVAAASEDPRFPPVGVEELDSIIVEVSVLTLPAPISVKKRSELPTKVRIGTDGLIVSLGPYSGLLLPQVATEFRLGQADFLSQACLKAGLPPDAWLEERTIVEAFQSEVFEESRPRGDVVRVDLGGH